MSMQEVYREDIEGATGEYWQEYVHILLGVPLPGARNGEMGFDKILED